MKTLNNISEIQKNSSQLFKKNVFLNMKTPTITVFYFILLLFVTSCKKENILPLAEQTSVQSSKVMPDQTTALASVRLGFTRNYALIANNSIINIGYSQVYGNLGLNSLGECSGFPKGLIHGSVEINNKEAYSAMADLEKMYENISLKETADMATLPADLLGITLTPGLYISNDINLKGELTIDAKGDENAVFIIKVSRNVILGDNVKMILKNNANANNIFWSVGGIFITGTSAEIKGNLVVLNSISIGENSSVEGRLLSLGGNIEINQSTISLPAVQ